MKNPITVAVILGTYNGEAYLEEQLNSILSQNGVKVQIFVRDDGSKDRTLEILREYLLKYENIHLINKDNTENMGVKKSFMEALKSSLSYSDKYEYFAFADQDDVWLPQKIISGIRMIENSKNTKGALYYSNKTIVDENLTLLYQEQFKEKIDFTNFLYVSHAYGCTIILNRSLATLACQYISPYAHLHDDWIHRLALCINADIVFDEKSYIYYRQHGTNTCGTFATDKKSLIHLIKRAVDFIVNGGGYNRDRLATDILENYSIYINDDTRIKLEEIANYKTSNKNKFNLIRKYGKLGYRDSYIWIIKVFLGYF